MPPFLYPPYATVLLSFSELLLDPTSSHTIALADATEARSNLRNALKDVAGGASEWLPVVDAAQAYLPHIYGLLGSLDVDDLLSREEPVFTWQSALTTSSLPGTSSLIHLPSFHSELIFALISYATALNNHACVIVKSIAAESSSSDSKRGGPTHIMTSAQEKGKLDKLAQAVDFLCRASGVFEHICDKVLPAWDSATRNVGAANGGKGKGKGKLPVECSGEVVRGLAVMAIADAHALAVSKLLAPFNQSITLRSPGPPLPKGHPSPSLLAKLYLHIASLYSSARSLVKTISSSAAVGSSEPTFKGVEVIPQLLDYLRKESSLADTTGRKWLGVEAGENPTGDKIGLAIAWLQDAKDRMEEVKKAGAVGGSTLKYKFKSLKIGDKDSKNSTKDRNSRVDEEMAEVNAYLKVYKQMNDTVSFQPVIPASSLQSLLPAGRPIITSKRFSPPRPSFGPGSSGYVPRSSDEEVEEGRQRTENPVDALPPASYAGSGSYF